MFCSSEGVGKRGKVSNILAPEECIESARSAGLRYVRDDTPGIRRTMGPLGFQYFAPGGRKLRRPAELKRIAALAIPPAWKDVWICPDPRGHLQATGRDARGRKQYRYHVKWRACRDETKYDRMPAFAAALPKIRARTTKDLALSGLPREKVLATVVRLLEKSLIRVGNEEYAKENGSVGLTTMKDRHVNIRGAMLRFEFRGKSGKKHCVDVNDRRLARIVRDCRDLPGQELFQYIDDDGARCSIDSGDVNAYLKEITGEAFTAKDFRTWAGTVLASIALRGMAGTDDVSATQMKRDINQAIEAVAGVLGNTRAVCRKAYIHPAIIESYVDGGLFGSRRRSTARKMRMLRPEEVEVLALLKRRAA